jgi:hypothetical protein
MLIQATDKVIARLFPQHKTGGALNHRQIQSPPEARRRAPLSLILSALTIGIAFGLFSPGSEQEAVDGSLVLAGLVDYPSQSPMSEYFLGTWTLIHQIGATMLRAGLDQTRVSEIFFVIPCALLVAAYASIIYCFTGRYWCSLIAAPLCYVANPLARFFVSPDYPTPGLIWGLGPDQTFGFWAQIGSAWIIGSIAAGRYALAGFSAFVMVAVHPVLGAYMIVLLLATVLATKMVFNLKADGFAKGAALGCVVTLSSLAIYFYTRPKFPGGIDLTAYQAYMQVWDVHRSQEMTSYSAVRVAKAALIAIPSLSVYILAARPRFSNAIMTSILILFAVMVSTTAYYMVHLVPDLLPNLVLRTAPGRFLNIQAYVCMPTAVGIVLGAIDQSTAHLKRNVMDRAFSALALVLLLLTVGTTVRTIVRGGTMGDYVRTVVEARLLGKTAPALEDEDFWYKVRKAKTEVAGVVLTTSETSRLGIDYGHLPIALLSSSFDFIPYVPQTAGAVAQIIQDGYGVSFFNPPPEIIRHRAALPADAERTYWAQLKPEDWCRISRSINVGVVLAPTKWSVTLPTLVKGQTLTLYKISCS